MREKRNEGGKERNGGERGMWEREGKSARRREMKEERKREKGKMRNMGKIKKRNSK